MHSRRKFLQGCVVLTLTGGLSHGLAAESLMASSGPMPAAGPTWRTRGGWIMVEDLSPEIFETWRGAIFQTTTNEGNAVRLEIAEITQKPKQQISATQSLQQFSVVFRGTGETPLRQGMYALESGSDKLEIFLVPVGREGNALIYEAAFSRLTDNSTKGA